MAYDVKQDPLFIKFLQDKQDIRPKSKKVYIITLNKFCKLTNTTLSNLVKKTKEQQNRIIEKTTKIEQQGDTEIVEKTIIKFDVNGPDSIIKQYLDLYLIKCKERNNKNTTINNNMVQIRAFLSHYDVTLPKYNKLPDDSHKWYLLTKEDFKYVINDSTLIHKSLIEFLISSGMRITDATSLSIRDFMNATSEYHDYVDVEEFIDNAPQDMIGSWYFHPHKTQRMGIECQTFNSPESSNSILQHLRKIKNEYLPNKNQRDNLNLKINKDDALFGSRNTYYKESIPSNAISDRFWIKNRKLREHRIAQINEKIQNGELSPEDYDNEVAKIPKFHAHACRKYFETMIARNCGDLRICTLLEGHVSPVATDSSYIKHDINDVKEAYMLALDDLSLEKTETKVYTSEVRREMEEKISQLEQELENKNREVNTVNDRVDSIEQILGDLGIDSIVNKVKKGD